MYHIRVMSKIKVGGKDVPDEKNFYCPHYEVTTIPVGHPFTLADNPNQVTGVPTEVGLYLQAGGPDPKTIHLPNDGHTIFVMNAGGQTIHTYRWPLTDTAVKGE